MNSVVHFEIMAEDPARAIAFYESVFGWNFEDYSAYTGSPYWGIVTKEEGAPGINGGLMPRNAPEAPSISSPKAFVCTVQVDDFDTAADNIIKHGGQVSLPKYALPGMAWQGYFTDTEGNLLGIHQADEQAK